MVQHNSRLIGGIYQAGQVIASGPLLTSWSAYNQQTGEIVGLLTFDLPPHLSEYDARQLLASLTTRKAVQSPHVLRLRDWGLAEQKVYIVTDPARGITLRQLMERENIGLTRSLNLAIQLTRGVTALQAEGVIESDLRPQFVLVDAVPGQEDRVQIADIGLRAFFQQAGYVSGQDTQAIEYPDPRYMSPESLYQGIIGSSSDVYQLGILLFELVTGRPPFSGRTPDETRMMQQRSPVPHMLQFKHDTPADLQKIVDRAMAKYPLERYTQASALLAALEALQQTMGIGQNGQPGTPLLQQSRPGELLPIPQKSVALTTEMVLGNGPVEAMQTVINGERPAPSRSVSATAIPNEAGIYAFLDLEKPGEETRRIPIKSSYAIIGRIDPKRQIIPEIDLSEIDPQMTVSRQHARIRFEKTFFYIEDLKSRNKTRLRELVLQPFHAELLEHGDTLCFGSVKLVFRIPGQHDIPVPRNLP
jgi:serine/threonine protein kinase